jgi:hypothetical protein
MRQLVDGTRREAGVEIESHNIQLPGQTAQFVTPAPRANSTGILE